MAKFNKETIEIASKYSVKPEIIAYIRSCHANLHLNREDMIARQESKIKNWKRNFAFLPKAIERRKKYAEQYPKHRDIHLAAAKNIQSVIDQNTVGGGRRTDRLNFLRSITEEEFKNVVL